MKVKGDVRRTRNLLLAFSIIVVVGSSLPVLAHQRPSRKKQKPAPVLSEAQQAQNKARDDLTKATEEYKKSLNELLALRQISYKKAETDFANVKQLYSEGLLSKRELEKKEAALADERNKVEEVRKQLIEADIVLQQTVAEEDVALALLKSPASTFGTVARTSYFRYDGPTHWSLSDAGSIQGFFYSKFHRALPITAFGQSELHTRMGFNHSNAMDVGLNPDSVEGKALISYLQAAGIPFIAFRRAVPGAASGPHIHIGKPSHKL